MHWNIPGTVLEGDRRNPEGIRAQFSAMFLPGDMMLGQVASLAGLETYTVQNWVRRGFLSPPRKKRYTMGQLCRILNINMLKSVLSMDRICALLQYVNGELDDESDDVIDDADLYFMFVSLAARIGEMADEETRSRVLEEVMAGYREPVPGAELRVRQVLQIMLTAWLAGCLGKEADGMLTDLLEKEK